MSFLKMLLYSMLNVLDSMSGRSNPNIKLWPGLVTFAIIVFIFGSILKTFLHYTKLKYPIAMLLSGLATAIIIVVFCTICIIFENNS